MNKFMLVFCACLVFLVTSCSGNIETSQAINTVLTPHSVITSTPTKPEPATTTLVPVTNTSSPTQVRPTSTDAGVIQNCLTVEPTPPDGSGYSGVVAFETYNPQTKYPISFYNFLTKAITTIPEMNLADLVVSPDRKLFAYRNFKSGLLEIFSSDQKRLASFRMPKDWGNIAEWHDNKSLIIILNEPEATPSTFVKYPRGVVLLDPFSGRFQTLPPDYPNIDKANSNFGWYQYGTTVYDKTLTRVIYPGRLESYPKPFNSGYILYSIPEKKKLAEITNLTWANRTPIWSPDSSQFIMMGEDEFYLVSIDGKVTKVTHMNPNFNSATRKGTSFTPYFYAWSPDGQQVAMWLENHKTKQLTLAILNPRTGIITDTCLPAGYDPKDFTTLPYPVWSPDGKSLVVAANFQPEDRSFDVVLIDLEKQVGQKIISNIFPVGWLLAP
jgi:hypothetical protein